MNNQAIIPPHNPGADRLRGYMALAEQRIGAAFAAEGLYVHLAGGFQGPHTLTFSIRLYEPTAANMVRALRLAPAIEAAINDGPARVYSERGSVYVEIPSPWPANIPGSALRGRRMAVPLGLTSRQSVAGVDFDQSPHLLIVGPTGRGKSTAMRTLAYHLARQNYAGMVGLLAITLKPTDWQAFAALRNTWAVVSNPQEGGGALAWLRKHMEERTQRGARLPHIFVFVDDLLNLLALTDVSGPLAEIASMGRAAGIHLIIGTQRLGKRGAGDVAVTSNMPVRLVFGTADAQDAAFFTGRGDTGAERLGRYSGDALLINDGLTVRVAVARVSDQDLGELPPGSLELRPWATTDSTVATVAPEEGEHGQAKLENPPLQPGCGTVAAVALPLPTRAPADDAERATIRTVCAETGSKSETCRRVWGFKDGKTWGWLIDVIGE